MKNRENDIEQKRHTLAHVLAMAVLAKYPDARLGIGPTIENGFYYDFDIGKPFKEEELAEFEEAMRDIISHKLDIIGKKITLADAKKIFKDQPFKVELAEEYSKEDKELTAYTTGDFTDLCKGGHIANTREIDPKSFQLTRIAGAYWRGSEKNPQLQRIYALAFNTPTELAEYKKILEEAEKRDHRKIGLQLGLFFFHETSPGMPYWLPKGVLLYNELIRFWRIEHAKRGYQEIISPLLNKKELYITSGHFDHYWSEMFVADMGENEIYGVKAMNCPNAMIVFDSEVRSYKDLPLRFSDTDTLHRYERSGTLNGLLRVREFRQDDAHCFVTEDQIEEEYKEIFAIVERFYTIFNLQYSFRLGTRPTEFLGEKETWDNAEEALKRILENSGKPFDIEEGDGAFYGPKIDILMKDVLGREWQMGTIQLDFQQPQRFGLKYAATDGSKKIPVAIHRVIYGSMERFIGILIEHFGGAFPFWLAPVQVRALTINEKVVEYAKNVTDKLKEKNVRVELDTRNESIGKKIREAELQKIPYIFVIGDKEAADETINVRTRSEKETKTISLEEFLNQIKKESVR